MVHYTPKPGFPAVIKSNRDLGREGYRGCSPWARNGIFIFSETRIGQSESTPEAGVVRERNKNAKNKWLTTPHEFEGAGTFVCLYCVMMREGHDRLMEKLRKEADAVTVRG